MKIGSYTVKTSGLIVRIWKIHHICDTCVSFKASLTSKTSGYVFETKNYKLPLDRISHWERIREH